MYRLDSDTEDAVGYFAISMAGHDKNEVFVIISEDREYVYLVDGRYRRLENPKRKKRKHIRQIHDIEKDLLNKLKADKVIVNDDIKRAIKWFNTNKRFV